MLLRQNATKQPIGSKRMAAVALVQLIRVFGPSVARPLTLVLQYLSYCRHRSHPSRVCLSQSVDSHPLPVLHLEPLGRPSSTDIDSHRH